MLATARAATFAIGILFGFAAGLPAGPLLIAQAQAAPIQEDDPGWDCRTMGDLECGPTNAQGVAAGRYVDGRLVAPWEPAWYGHPDLVPAS